MKKNRFLILAALLCVPAGLRAADAAATSLIPSYIPADRPAQPELTAELRAKTKTLGLNATAGGKVSRALALLPNDRARSGIISFEIEGGTRAGVYQCEALGRGITSTSPAAGWQWGVIGSSTVYYIAEDATDGATIPGIYDLRNISPETYEIDLLGARAAAAPPQEKKKKYFSAVFADWYPASVKLMPVDMMWAEDSQEGSQGEGVPYFERRPTPGSEASKARQARQLAHNPKYYFGPYGRSGFAVHTDQWEEASRRGDPKFSGRPELADFRWRDTNGCLKLRPGCLALLNEFIAGQAALGRRVQLEVRATELLDEVPVVKPEPAGQ